MPGLPRTDQNMMDNIAEAFVQHLLKNQYFGPGSVNAINLVQLDNIYNRAFQPESSVSTGYSSNLVIDFMRKNGWITINSDNIITGLPRQGVSCLTSSQNAGGTAAVSVRNLASKEEISLKKIRKTEFSPLEILSVECGSGGYFQSASDIIKAVSESSPNMVMIFNTRITPQLVKNRDCAWPTFSFIRQDASGLLLQYSTKLHVEEVYDRLSKELNIPVLWLAVTQGKGQGKNKGETTRIVACVCFNQEKKRAILSYLQAAVPRVMAKYPGCNLILQGNLAGDQITIPNMPCIISVEGSSLFTDVPRNDIKVEVISILNTGNSQPLLVKMGNTYCAVCCTSVETVTQLTEHQNTSKHKKNRIFHFYQREKKNLLQNPHRLGLEIKPTDVDQGVVYSQEEGLVTITSTPNKTKTFTLLLTNIRTTDLEEERDPTKPKQIGIVVEQVGIARAEKVFQLEDEYGLTGEQPKKIRLRTSKKYRINVKVGSKQVGHYRVPLIIAFYHDTESPKAKDDPKRWIMDHMGLELLLKVQIPEMDSLAPSKPFSQPKRITNWIKDSDAKEVIRVTVPKEMQQDRSGDLLKNRLPLEYYNLSEARRKVLTTNFTKAESREEREQVAKCRKLLETGLNETSYKDFWRLLLHAEEHQLETDIRHYDMGGVTLRQLPSKKLFELRVPGLEENRPSVIQGDRIFLRQEGVSFEYEGHVDTVQEDKVWLLLHDTFIGRYMKGMKFDVRFTIGRFPMRNMHRAVDLALNKANPLLPYIFPQDSQLIPKSAALPNIRCKNKKIEENKEQLTAVQHIIAGSSGAAPYLVFGPPGTGKTVTVVEAIKQVYQLYNTSKIIATAPSNAAADLLAERLKEHIQRRDILRIHASSRNVKNIPESIKGISNLENGRYIYPKLDRLEQYRILVVTLVSSGRLVSAGFPLGHFTHVFIDEAGQAMEPEVLIPLQLVDQTKGGKVIMVGDPKQLGPVIRSNLATKHGLSTSLLERLMTTELYSKKPTYDPRCITKLVRNFRSHPALLDVPGRLFYDSELQPCADKMMVNSCLQFPGLTEQARGKIPLIFRGVIGQDQKEDVSPSFFNSEEAVHVLDYVKQITSLKENRVLPKEIGVIAPYRRQVQKIRKKLKEHNFEEITVGSTEEFQGQERKVIIVSTVRSSPQYLTTDNQYRLGFLSNPKRFNVAITRAKALLIIVGNPHILSQDPSWGDLLTYALKKGCYTGCDYDQETDDDLDRLEAKMRGLLLKGREVDEITLLTQLEEPAWRTDV